MKVNTPNGQAQNLQEAQSANQSKRTDKASAAAKSKNGNPVARTEGSANTEISSRAKEMAQAKSVAAQAPEVRNDRIERLKQMIAEGKYKVDADKVAERMVKEHQATADLG